jgi:hypothetical protein
MGGGGYKMHIFATNIPTFHSSYRRYVLITNEFHEFYWSTISETSDDGKAPYEPKSMHIFNMSKIRHSYREYDMSGWCDTKPGPSRAKVGPTDPTSLASRLGVGAFSNSALPTCRERSVHGAFNAQSRCVQETWRSVTLPGRPAWQVVPLSPIFCQSTNLTPL